MSICVRTVPLDQTVCLRITQHVPARPLHLHTLPGSVIPIAGNKLFCSSFSIHWKSIHRWLKMGTNKTTSSFLLVLWFMIFATITVLSVNEIKLVVSTLRSCWDATCVDPHSQKVPAPQEGALTRYTIYNDSWVKLKSAINHLLKGVWNCPPVACCRSFAET